MNPFDLDPTGLLVWGLVAHIIADLPLQSDWMATHKALRGRDGSDPLTAPWWSRHPAAYVHAGIHAIALTFVFGWVSLPLALIHLVIDTRTPVAWWSRLIGQTQPMPPTWLFRHGNEGHCVSFRTAPKDDLSDHIDGEVGSRESQGVVVDVGWLVRLMVDQTFHVATIASAALIVGALT